MRLTPLRQAMLAFLATQRMPVSLEMIAQADGVRGQCDATTVYRTQALFKAADIVRQVGTPGKVSLFLLNVPEETRQFLICRRCGCIKEMALPDQVIESIREVATFHGFSSPWQDYEIYGLCPACAAATRDQIRASKLPLIREPAAKSPPKPPG
jgi:Fe2+ or Zn2+ uptake regulation protein